MATEYIKIIKVYLDEAVKCENGHTVIKSEMINSFLTNLIDDFVLISKTKANDGLRETLCREINWLYNQLMYISINNTNERTEYLIKELIKVMISKTVKFNLDWFQQLITHQIKILEILECFHLFEKDHRPIQIEFAGSEKSPIDLQFRPIVARNRDEFEQIVHFVLEILIVEIQIYADFIINNPLNKLTRLIVSAFKCSRIEIKSSALNLLTEYFKLCQSDDSIEVVTNVMGSLSGFYQVLNSLIKNVPSNRELYSQFALKIAKFCNVLMSSRVNHLKFKSLTEQKLFIDTFTDVIYEEYKFVQLATQTKSIIDKLVQTFDFIMYRADFAEETIKGGVSSLMGRIGYGISEIFPILKYTIILELEKCQNSNSKVLDISESWKILHSEMMLKVKESHQSKIKFNGLLEWILNTLTMAIHTTDLFTRRHQIKDLVHMQKMKIENWNYKQIHWNFFQDTKIMANDIITLAKEGLIIDDSVDILIDIFVTFLQLVNDITEQQKLFMLSVIFLPFLPMMKNTVVSKSKEYWDVTKALPPNIGQYIKDCSNERIENMKLKTLRKIAYLKLSEIGKIGHWFGTSITRLMLSCETNPIIEKMFYGEFKNLLISNVDVFEQYLSIYRDCAKTPLLGKCVLCLQDKNVIVIKCTSPPSFSKIVNYDVFCKSCQGGSKCFIAAKSELDWMTLCMELSNGYIIPFDKQNVLKKISILNIDMNLVDSLEACITHHTEFIKNINSDNGESFLQAILKDDEKVLKDTEQCFEKLIKTIIESENLSNETKIEFFINLYQKVTDLAVKSTKDFKNLKIQELFASMITKFGSNAKEIPLKTNIFFKNEKIAVNCFLTLIIFMFNCDKPIVKKVNIMALKMLQDNDMDFMKAVKWHGSIIEGVSFYCAIECVSKQMSFFESLKDFLQSFGCFDANSFLKRNFDKILSSIYPNCIKHQKTYIVDELFQHMDLTLLDVIISKPLELFRKIYSFPKDVRRNYQNFIEREGKFKYKDIFQANLGLIIQHAAVYYARDSNFFHDVMRELLEPNERDTNDGIILIVVQNFLGILVYIDSILADDDADRSLKESALASISLLLRFIGSDHTSELCFKVMGLLKSSAKHSSNFPFKKVYINLWNHLIRTCNPSALGPFLSAIFVAIEPYIVEFPDKVQSICYYLLEHNQSVLSRHVADLFYIDRTTYPKEIKDQILFQIASQVITEGNAFDTNIKRLIKHIRSESADSDVKNYCLQYLHEFAKINRSQLNELIFAPKKNDTIISDLMNILLDCSRKKGSTMLLIQVAKCLGEIGILNPDVPIENEKVSRDTFSIHCDGFALHMLTLLCKDYKDLHYSDIMAAGIQEIIADRQMAQAHPLYSKLSGINQQLIKPFFKSRYKITASDLKSLDVAIFWVCAHTSNHWSEQLSIPLIDKIESKATSKLLFYLKNSMKYNSEIASYLLPYIFLHYLQSRGSEAVDMFIKKELNLIFNVIRCENFKDGEEIEVFKAIIDQFYNPQQESTFKEKETAECTNEFYGTAIQIGKLIFEVFDFLTRFQNQNGERSNRTQEFLNQFDSKVLAEASYNCGDYQRALIYYESYLKTISDEEREDEWAFLVHIYAKLGDFDSIAGVSYKRKSQWSATDKMFIGKTTGKWEDPHLCIEQIIREPQNITVEVASTTLGCLVAYNHCEQAIMVADQMLQVLHDKCKKSMKRYDDVKTEALLRLSRFDELEEVIDMNNGIDLSNWSVVQAKLILRLHAEDSIECFNEDIQQVRLKVMKSLNIYQSNSSIYKINYDSIIRLHMLTDIEKTCEIIQQIKTPNNSTRMKTIETFLTEINARKKFFKLTPTQYESLLALHRVLFNGLKRAINISMGQEAAKPTLKIIDYEIGQTWLNCAVAFKDQFDQANAFLMEAGKFNPPGLFIHQAKHIWRRSKNVAEATKILQANCEELEKLAGHKNNQFYGKGQLLIARYNADAAAVDYHENKEMFKKALSVNIDQDKAYLYYAEYLDRAAFLTTSGAKEQEVNSIKTDTLKEILEAYGNGLLYSSQYVFQALPRFLQLWLDGTMPRGRVDPTRRASISPHNAELNAIVKKFASKISTFKFYTAFSQLVSRIGHPCPEVYAILKIIISKLIASYPRHSLWYIVHAIKSNKAFASERMHEILKMVPKERKLIADFVKYINEMMLIAKIQEDQFIVGKAKKVNAILNDIKSQLLMPLQQNLQITNEALMDKLTDDDQIFIYKMNDDITILKSMQKPKKLSFIGSNGETYILMLKFKDDLRIDFRFMEFCKVLNDYFRKDQEASRRSFRIRTYSVSPINEEIGIIEWLNNMETLKNVINSQYINSSIEHVDQRKLKTLHTPWERNSNKIESLRKMERMHPPILGRWYQRTFLSSQSFFTARHQYIKSTAVMSVVGYLFGLGDRHLENILIDTNTGEIAHVDFNCMFNANENLNVPETVPFRLTQSMIEAMGVLGTEGSFRKCCECTMQLLQNHKNVLISYLRPFVFDPLIHSSAPNEEQINAVSLKAINNIKRKLDGYPRKFQKFLELPLSAEGHVKFIIDEATSPENLSRMYYYWTPFI